MSLAETIHPQDALLALGTPARVERADFLLQQQLYQRARGPTLQVQQATGQPVSITIGVSNTGLVNAVQALVTDYNSYNTTLTNDTSYNTSSNTGAILSDDPTATELSTVLSNLLSGQVSGTGSIQSLSQLGITFNQDGSLPSTVRSCRTRIRPTPTA